MTQVTEAPLCPHEVGPIHGHNAHSANRKPRHLCHCGIDQAGAPRQGITRARPTHSLADRPAARMSQTTPKR